MIDLLKNKNTHFTERYIGIKTNIRVNHNLQMLNFDCYISSNTSKNARRCGQRSIVNCSQCKLNKCINIFYM